MNNKRTIIVDALSVGTTFTNSSKFAVRGLEICIELFEKRGHPVRCVLPRNTLADDENKINQLLVGEKLILIPESDADFDRFILTRAAEVDGVVITNKDYSQYLYENSSWSTIINSQTIGFTFVEEMIIIPTDPYGRNGPNLNQILEGGRI